MVAWRDQGILLSQRRHGESAAIIEVLTPSQGRALGVVRGGAGRKMAPILQPGAQLDVAWRARLEAHLGHFTVEPVRSRAAQVMGSRLALAGLNAVCALCHFALPEREAQPDLYARTLPLMDLLGQDDLWPLAYLGWEQALLTQLGFGLDLSACAVTGSRTDLAYISPRSGRAVARAAAGQWRDRLLPLSPALLGQGSSDRDILSGLRATGHMLAAHVAPALGADHLPEARQRFVDMLRPVR